MRRREFLIGSSTALLSASAGLAREPRPFSIRGVRYSDEAEFIKTQRCGTPTPSLHVQRQVEELRKGFRLLNPGFAKHTTETWIPVHFHVIHDGDHGRIPESMIDDQIAVLNDTYWPSYIVFEKASIEYVDNAAWFNMEFGSPDAREAKTMLALDTERSLNFYTGNPAAGLLGFATFPWDLAGDPLMDGVVVLYDSLPGGAAAPFNLGLTGTHEVGHWLGLFHTFENGCAVPGDAIDDTSFEAEPAFGCPFGRDTCPNLIGEDPITNFMNYSDDACMDHFTFDQFTRMLVYTVLFRPNLLQPSDLSSLRLVSR